ncbi:MAG: hypothetical protein KIT31_11425 [Deltaproteobacteria bacterium]|nr:hypothetical protein [Deltaproteobacteria bacterium]
MRKWIKAWISVGLLAGLGTALYADARDDLKNVKNDHVALKSRYDAAKSRVDTFINDSTVLRQMDEQKLDELITALCSSDVARDNDEIDRINKDLKDKIADRVTGVYNTVYEAGSRVQEEVTKIENEVANVQRRAKDLESNNDVKSDAESVRREIENLQELTKKLTERLNADYRSLTNVKNGTMNGANNPLIRARMEYGKEMHRKLQGDYSCDERELTLGSGRPDCVKFIQDDCQVIEFKPSSYAEDDAVRQATKYLIDVRDRMKSDDRAKKCKWTSDGPIFRAVGKLYPKCTTR